MMNKEELDMNDLIDDFIEYSTSFNKETCLYYANYLKEYQKEKLDLQQENEYLIASDLEKMETIKQLKDRIDKAIEYLKRKENVPEWYDTDFMICINILNGGSGNFEDILKGEDNE